MHETELEQSIGCRDISQADKSRLAHEAYKLPLTTKSWFRVSGKAHGLRRSMLRLLPTEPALFATVESLVVRADQASRCGRELLIFILQLVELPIDTALRQQFLV
jgi:hypothetical protein